MNVVFLLGNGFDLQLGLKTKYEHFYAYYCLKQSTNELVGQLKKHINNYLVGNENRLTDVNWENLEIALGKYTKELKSYEELKTVYLDINKELMSYLRIQENQFIRDEKFCSKLRADFSKPERYLTINEKRKYSKLLDGETFLTILSFNYTNCCETIYEKNVLSINAIGRNTVLNEIAHIHGDLSMLNVLMGVNDSSQIDNENIREDVRVKRMLVKPSSNDMIDNQRKKRLLDVLDSARVIAIYGASLGDSDKMWRDKLRDLLKSRNTFFLINKFQEGFDNIYDQADVEDQTKIEFISKLGLEAEAEKYMGNVFVAVTKSIFKPKE